MIRKLFASAAAVALVAGFASAAEIKSGPQTGEEVPGPFTPLNITGKMAGQKHCLYCENGKSPVIMVFARTNDAATQKLLKKIDEVTAKNSDCEMGSFVVFCSDDSALEADLKKLNDKENFKKLVLSIDSPAGPSKYKVSKDADVTIVLYTNREVKANHAFKKGELKDADIEKVLADVTKIKPTK